MQTSRPPLPDLTPIRSVLRHVRAAMREQRDRVEADVPALLPAPASSMALHLLRDINQVAHEVNGLLSGVAHHIFPEPEAAKPTAMADTAMSKALAATARRLAVKNPTALLARLTGLDGQEAERFDAHAAARLLLAISPEAEAEEILAVFAAGLAVLAAQTEQGDSVGLSASAADLARALSPRILAACRAGQQADLAALVAKYAAHV